MKSEMTVIFRKVFSVGFMMNSVLSFLLLNSAMGGEYDRPQFQGSLRTGTAINGSVKAFTNSLGMRFVPVPRTKALFCVWLTRVKDFEIFVKEMGYDATHNCYTYRSGAWKRDGIWKPDGSWKKLGFPQTETHPVCGVNWNDAKAFCQWLTEKERRAGKIGAQDAYRLPTDLEWSAAVGLPLEAGATPKDRDWNSAAVELGATSKERNWKKEYPWGTAWPPPKGAGNYAPSLEVDDYEFTSPVGSFAANQYGLYDMGGNVWEWCEDWFDNEKKLRVLRGASWSIFNRVYALSSYRNKRPPDLRFDYYGFRCVLAPSSSP